MYGLLCGGMHQALIAMAHVKYRVARWYIFKPKITICINLEGIEMVNVGIFYGRLEYIR
jgi:hypothetical protein